MTGGEAFIGLATLALAVATAAFAIDGHLARREDRRQEKQTILRTALAEQLRNCRIWAARDPSRRTATQDAFRGSEPQFAALSSALNRLDLQADVVRYAIWLMDVAGEDWARFTGDLPRPSLDDSNPGLQKADVRSAWSVLLERLQVLSALVAGEARRRGWPDVAAPNDNAPWTIVAEWPERGREMMAINDRAMRGAPPFPADPAFASVSPGARDRAGAATGARTQEALLRR